MQIGAVARCVLVVVVDVQACCAASSARDIDACSSGVSGGISAQLSSDAGGSGGRLNVHAESPVIQDGRLNVHAESPVIQDGRLDAHAESPVVQCVRAVLREDELDRV